MPFRRTAGVPGDGISYITSLARRRRRRLGQRIIGAAGVLGLAWWLGGAVKPSGDAHIGVDDRHVRAPSQAPASEAEGDRAHDAGDRRNRVQAGQAGRPARLDTRGIPAAR